MYGKSTNAVRDKINRSPILYDFMVIISLWGRKAKSFLSEYCSLNIMALIAPLLPERCALQLFVYSKMICKVLFEKKASDGC